MKWYNEWKRKSKDKAMRKFVASVGLTQLLWTKRRKILERLGLV